MIRLLERHMQLLQYAIARWRWRTANHDARRIMARTARRYPWTAGMYAMPTPQQQLADYVQTTLSVGCTNVATVLTLTSVAGLPTVGNFMLRIDDVAPAITFEWVEVSSVNVGASQVTCARGQNGTTGIAHNAGAFVGNKIPAAMLLRSFGWGILTNGYQQIVANQGGITTAVDITGLAATVTVSANRRIKVTVFITGVQSTVATDLIIVTIMEGVAQLSQANIIANNQSATCFASLTPTAGAHTYKAQIQRVGTGTGTLSANATAPAFILVEDIGPA